MTKILGSVPRATQLMRFKDGFQFVNDAHRDGKRFVGRADEKLAAFLEVEAAIRESSLRNESKKLSAFASADANGRPFRQT